MQKGKTMSDKIYPCLWFDGKAHEAADFYCDIFPNSKIVNKTPMVAVYELNGSKYMNLNGGPEYKFNEAISMVVTCENQEEIDYYWTKLTDGGKEGKCGWLKDKFGVSWQVVPKILGELMRDESNAPKVMYAFMQMKKLIISDLLEAFKN
jgi:predicted 3-demethylubiquinone-9 3-methyltransferase (glyoxalase superfamily)